MAACMYAFGRSISGGEADASNHGGAIRPRRLVIEHMDGLLHEETEEAHERTSHVGVMRVARSKIRLDGPTCVVTLAVHGGVGISLARSKLRLDGPTCVVTLAVHGGG